jgi:FkbM family methyltransferase
MSSQKSRALIFAKKYKFFKKCYLFYNIYLRNYKFFFNNSQFGEEKIILKLFKKNFKGNFVDLGCFHPIRQNNTYKMYRLGWKGINIDLNPLTIDLFNFARSKDINICTAISDKKKTTNLYYLGDLASQNTIEKKHTNFLKSHFGISKKDIKTRKIKTQKLEDVLARHKFFKIDFMNIDIEGHELKVLRSLNFKKFNIKIICIEILDHDKFSKIRKKEVLRFFKKNGYILKHRSVVNYIFKRI